jgi:transcriptional regulator with XRE-family HTH domain
MDMPIISVAGKLHQIRVSKALTVAQLGDQLGIHPNTLRGFLSTDNPTVASVYDLANKLQCSMAYLISAEQSVESDYMYYVGEDGKQFRPNVAARIEIILKEKGLRKYRVSQRMGVSSSWWQPIMRRNNPSMKTLARIAFGLDVSPLELIKPVSAEKYGREMMPELHSFDRGMDN